MKHRRRAILQDTMACMVGVLFSLACYSSPSVTPTITGSCVLHGESIKRIKDTYGKGSITESSLIQFNSTSKNERNGFRKGNAKRYKDITRSTVLPDGEVLVPLHPERMLLSLSYNPEMVRAPITLLMEEYDYWGKFKRSNYVAQLKAHGNVSSISLEAKSTSGNIVVMIAVTKHKNAILYTCQKLFTFGGEDGCC